MPQNQAEKNAVNAAQLMALAIDHFGPKRMFTEAEGLFLAKAPLGKPVACGIPSEFRDSPNNDPAQSIKWSAQRAISAELIRWLCVDRKAREQLDPQGINIDGAKITGDLDLSLTVLIFPLQLSFCALNSVYLIKAKCPAWISAVMKKAARW
jgi:hypothetical protein